MPQLPDVVEYAIPAFILLIIFEVVVWRWKKSGDYEWRDSAASITMGVGNNIIGFLGGALVIGIYFAAHQIAVFDFGFSVWAFIACFFAEDLAYYWFHRVSHERRWFWASHIVHHSSQHYNLSTALRQSWTGIIGCTWIFWIPLILLGFDPLMVIFFQGISLVYQFWIHTETIGKLGPLEWVLNTPSHHRVHHAVNNKYIDANYAGVLIIWDRLFGTFVPEGADGKPRYGIVRQLGTFNPLVIAFHEWIAMFRDVFSAKDLRSVAGYLFGPPGWKPDGSHHNYPRGAAARKLEREQKAAEQQG